MQGGTGMPEVRNPSTWYRIDELRRNLLKLGDVFDDLPVDYTKLIIELYEKTDKLLSKSVEPLERELSRRAAAGENLMVLP